MSEQPKNDDFRAYVGSTIATSLVGAGLVFNFLFLNQLEHRLDVHYQIQSRDVNAVEKRCDILEKLVIIPKSEPVTTKAAAPAKD